VCNQLRGLKRLSINDGECLRYLPCLGVLGRCAAC